MRRPGRSEVRLPAGRFCSPKRPHRLWGTPSLLFDSYRGFHPGREVDHAFASLNGVKRDNSTLFLLPSALILKSLHITHTQYRNIDTFRDSSRRIGTRTHRWRGSLPQCSAITSDSLAVTHYLQTGHSTKE